MINNTNWTREKIEALTNRSNENNFPSILKEWFVKDDMDINPKHNSVCELCGQSNLYYEYYIYNRMTENEMLIGSVCINLFYEKVEFITISANNELKELNKSQLKQHLNKLFIKRIIKKIEDNPQKIKLNDWETEFFNDVKIKIVNEESLSPKQGTTFMKVISMIVESNVDILSKIGKIIKINLRKNRNVEQLIKMLDTDITTTSSEGSYLKYLLSPEQKRKYLIHD